MPYVSGVLAMGWQLRLDLTSEQILKLLFDTTYLRPDGAHIIDPPAFIQAVKSLAEAG